MKGRMILNVEQEAKSDPPSLCTLATYLVQAKEREAGVHSEIGGNFPLDRAVIEGQTIR